MLDYILSNMSIVWVVLMVVFLVVEAATAGLTCIWFAIGSLAALIAALFDAQLWLQIVWFLVISFVTLYFTRPLVKKYVNSRSQPTNADMVIGKEALVTEDIDNVEATGAGSGGGKVWTARPADGGHIKSGAVVSVLRIEGVKLIVEPVPAQSQA